MANGDRVVIFNTLRKVDNSPYPKLIEGFNTNTLYYITEEWALDKTFDRSKGILANQFPKEYYTEGNYGVDEIVYEALIDKNSNAKNKCVTYSDLKIVKSNIYSNKELVKIERSTQPQFLEVHIDIYVSVKANEVIESLRDSNKSSWPYYTYDYRPMESVYIGDMTLIYNPGQFSTNINGKIYNDQFTFTKYPTIEYTQVEIKIEKLYNIVGQEVPIFDSYLIKDNYGTNREIKLNDNSGSGSFRLTYDNVKAPIIYNFGPAGYIL